MKSLPTIEELATEINGITDRLNFLNGRLQKVLAERKRKDEEASKALLNALFGVRPVKGTSSEYHGYGKLREQFEEAIAAGSSEKMLFVHEPYTGLSITLDGITYCSDEPGFDEKVKAAFKAMFADK